MTDRFDNYNFEDFLLDPDFCEWVIDGTSKFSEEYSDYFEENPEVYQTALKAKTVLELLKENQVTTPLTRKLQIWNEIRRTKRSASGKRVNMQKYLAYAAVMIFLTAIGSLVYYNVYQDNDIDKYIQSYRTDHKETILKIDDDKSIEIASEESEIVYNSQNHGISINNEKYIEREENSDVALNQLIVPFGKKSKIILEDNSEVWLNAGSQLIYPEIFDEKREVMLIGEAFFKIAKNKEKPFIVKTGEMQIEVLGTSFNVKAYPDEDDEETVLVEGKISMKIKDKFIKNKIEIKPDQRLVVSKETLEFDVFDVNVDDYTSWIDGVFIFHGEPLKNVLKRVSRYYNLNIAGEGEIRQKFISGKLDLKEDAKKVLDAIATISNGEYTEENGKILFRLKDAVQQ